MPSRSDLVHLGAILEHLRAILGRNHLKVILGLSWVVLELFWAILGPSWAILVTSGELFNGLSNVLSKGHEQAFKRPLRGPLKVL